MQYKDTILEHVAEQACQEISRQVIKDLRRMKEGLQSGDDSPLRNIWDEVCVQMQTEQSVMWEAYEETILPMIGLELDRLDKAVISAIWLQTEEGLEWDAENQVTAELDTMAEYDKSEFYFIEIERHHKVPKNVIPGSVEYDLNDIAAYILEKYVLNAAATWKNKRIGKFIDEGESL
jgi:hypothetical protein